MSCPRAKGPPCKPWIKPHLPSEAPQTLIIYNHNLPPHRPAPGPLLMAVLLTAFTGVLEWGVSTVHPQSPEQGLAWRNASLHFTPSLAVCLPTNVGFLLSLVGAVGHLPRVWLVLSFQPSSSSPRPGPSCPRSSGTPPITAPDLEATASTLAGTVGVPFWQHTAGAQ